jgi:hypothetical protein
MKRIISAVVLSGAVAFMGAAGAQATTYPAPDSAVSVSDGTVAPGETFTFSGTDFAPGETVQITISSDNITATGGGGGGGAGGVGTSVGAIIQLAAVTTTSAVADQTGKFSIPVTLNEVGVYTLTAKGLTSGKTQSVVVTVAAPTVAVAGATTSDNGLAATGANDKGLIAWSAVGLGALALGAGSVVAVRRKVSESGSAA